jgi:hypothetical protein
MVICESTRLRGDDIWVVKTPLSVIPAKAGTQGPGRPTWRATTSRIAPMAPGLRRDDEAGTNTAMTKASA